MKIPEIKQFISQKKLIAWIVVIYLLFTLFFFANILNIFLEFRTFTNDSSSFQKQLLQQNTTITQPVRLGTHSLREIVVLFFLTDPEREGEITVSLHDPRTGELVMEGSKIYMPSEGEQRYKLKSYNSIRVSKKQYILAIKGSNISLKKEVNTNTFLYRVYGSIAVKYLIVLTIGYWIAVFFVLFLALWLVYRKISLPTIYLISSLLFGMVILLILPPFAVPDERIHFYSAYDISNIFLGRGSFQENGGLLMRACDEKILPPEFSSNPDFLRDLTEIINVSDYKKYYPHFVSNISNTADSRMLKFNKKITNAFVGYIPQTLGIIIARLIGFNQFGLFYLGRFFNLLCCSLFMFLGMKIAKIKNLLFFTVALLPMFLQQSASYSYDGVINTTASVFIMIVMSFYFDREMDNLKLLLALLSGLILFSLKSFVYFPIVFLPLILIKDEYFYSIRKALLNSFVILLILISIWIFFGSVIFSKYSAYRTALNLYGNEIVLYDIGLVARQPLKYLSLFFNTYSSNLFTFLNQMTGGLMAIRNIEISNFLSLFLFGLLLFLILDDSRKSSKIMFSIQGKVILFSIIFLVINLVSVGMLFNGSGYGRNNIGGIQGRYFLPVLPIILLLLQSKIKIIKNNIHFEVMVSIMLLNALVLINVLYILLK